MGKRVAYENLIIDLYIFDKLKRPSANMSTAKIIYLYEDQLFKENMIGAHYKMIRYRWGPYNNSIGTHLKNLAANGFLNSKEKYYDKAEKDVLIYFKNKKTRDFLKNIDELIEDYNSIFNILDDIIEEYGDLNAEELKEFIYSLENTGQKNQRIIDYQMLRTILDPGSLRWTKLNFWLDEEWYDTIEILLNPDLRIELEIGIKNAQFGKFSQL